MADNFKNQYYFLSDANKLEIFSIMMQGLEETV